MFGRVALATGIATTALLTLAACGGEIAKADVEQQISKSLEKQVGVKPDKIACPHGLAAKVGTTMRCTLTKDGDSIGLTVKVDSVSGTTAHYKIQVDQK